MITLTYRESKIKKIKDYLTFFYKEHCDYDVVKLWLVAYPCDTLDILHDIALIVKTIKFKKLFKFINILKYISKILDNIVEFLLYIKHYDVLYLVEKCLFYLSYYIDRYIYGKNEFFFIYKCRYEPEYYAKCLKYFLKLKLRTGKRVLPFNMFMIFTFMIVFYVPCFWAIIRDIEKFNTFDNIVHYWHSNISPL